MEKQKKLSGKLLFCQGNIREFRMDSNVATLLEYQDTGTNLFYVAWNDTKLVPQETLEHEEFKMLYSILLKDNKYKYCNFTLILDVLKSDYLFFQK